MNQLIKIAKTLAERTSELVFQEPVVHVYNPLVYAWKPHQAYLTQFGQGPKDVVLVGMNPGPFGMAQTGVPFGDVQMVKTFLKIEQAVGKPSCEHPKRPIDGFDCKRGEVSGTRLWGYFQEKFKTPDAFAKRFFVLNYCPLIFLESSGRNRTPDKLPIDERQLLFDICDTALRDTVLALEATYVIGVGAFAKKRAEKALADVPVTIAQILHPSPASPMANRGWAEQAEQQLEAIGVF